MSGPLKPGKHHRLTDVSVNQNRLVSNLGKGFRQGNRYAAFAFIRQGARQHHHADIASAKLDIRSQRLDGFPVIIIFFCVRFQNQLLFS